MDVWGSFPLADEAVDLESIDFTDLGSVEIPEEDSNALPKLSPGHYRSTLLLDGIKCSSSTHSSPAGSFDGTPAHQTLPAAATQQPDAAPPAAEQQDSPAALDLPATGTAAAATLLPAPATNSTPAAAVALDSKPVVTLALGSNSSSSHGLASHHPAPVSLQLPDFSAFMLPTECTFAESSMDDGLTTPTPHTPVVQNIFAGDGPPVGCHSYCAVNNQQNTVC